MAGPTKQDCHNSAQKALNTLLESLLHIQSSPFDTSDDQVEEFHGMDPGLPMPQTLKMKEATNLLASLPNVRAVNEPAPRRRNSTASLANFSNFTTDFPQTPKKRYKKKKKKPPVPSETDEYQIEYSVFQPIRNLHHINDSLDIQAHLLEILKAEGVDVENNPQPDNFIADKDFQQLVTTITHDVEFDSSLRPQRISQGLSGSYFIMGKRPPSDDDSESEVFKRGVFKPKDEEPYGPLSPKWTKWLHRTLFPCFFGRSCLIPNLGYISEAAACVLDRQLLSYIVPYTDVIYLKSNTFYYSLWERMRSKNRRYKIGSFQMFLNGYIEAHTFFRMYPVPQDIDRLPHTREYVLGEDETLELANFTFKWSRDVLAQFQVQLEKLVILDYIMRNTDRGADNWMIKLEWRISGAGLRHAHPVLKIGAIDSGLAFPWKHPDEWRSFPFGWLFLPYSIIGQPFSAKTRQHYLPLLTLKYWWESTVTKLKEVFSKDNDFKERLFVKQMAVLKGQAFNVVEILKLHYAGPLELTRRENLLIWDDVMNIPVLVGNNVISHAMHSSIYDLDSPIIIPPTSTETTPLLKPGMERHNSSSANSCDALQMSGFEYNLNLEDDSRHMYEVDEETNTKRVVIERLEKVCSKLPVFTWC